MTPEEFRATNRLWWLQVMQWSAEATFASDEFRKDLRRVCEAAAIIREYSSDMGTAERINFVKDVLRTKPAQWKQTWCRPDNYERWVNLHDSRTGSV